MNKVCRDCRKSVSTTQFIKKGNGFNSYCKVCQGIRSKKWYELNKDRHKKIAANYYQRNRQAKILYQKSHYRKRYVAGLCERCNEPISVSRYCIYHHIWQLVRSMSKRVKQPIPPFECRKIVKSLVTDIPKVCPFTKEPVFIGINLHLDHKIPISQRPDLVLDLDNLQWVSKAYNYCKWDMTDEEFAMKYKLTYIGK